MRFFAPFLIVFLPVLGLGADNHSRFRPPYKSHVSGGGSSFFNGNFQISTISEVKYHSPVAPPVSCTAPKQQQSQPTVSVKSPQISVFDSLSKYEIFEKYKNDPSIRLGYGLGAGANFQIDIIGKESNAIVASYTVDRYDPDMQEERDYFDEESRSYLRKCVEPWDAKVSEDIEAHSNCFDDQIDRLVEKYSSLNTTILKYVFTTPVQYFCIANNISCLRVVYTILNGHRHFSEDPSISVYSDYRTNLKIIVKGNKVLGICSQSILIEEIVDEYVERKRHKNACEQQEIDEKNLREIDDRAFAICKSKLSTFSRDVVLKLTEQLFRDELNPFSCNWLQNNNQDLSGNCTFGGWNFMPQALLGLVTYNFAPRLAVLALEGALCSEAAVLTSACALAPEVICVAAGAAGIVLMADAACKTVRAIIKAVEVAQNIVRAYNTAQKTECVMPRTSTQVLESEAEPETLLGTEETTSTDPACSGTGGPEPPDDEDKNEISAILKRISESTKQHILQEKHKWQTAFSNPNQSWGEILKMIENALSNGIEKIHAVHPEQIIYYKEITVNSITVIVRYVKDGEIIKISNAFIPW